MQTEFVSRLRGVDQRLFADPRPTPDEGSFQVDNTSEQYYTSPYYKLFLKKGRVSSDRCSLTSSNAPGRLDAHLFLGVGRTPCRWELSRLLSSIRGRQAAKAKRELAGTEVPPVDLGAGLKGSLRESMCQAAIRILRATAAFAELL